MDPLPSNLEHSILTESHFRRIVENANEGVWIVERTGKTVYANQQIARMLRVNLADLAGRSALDFIFEEDIPLAMAEKERRDASAEGQRLEFRYRRADGEELWALIQSSIVPGGPGESDLVVGLFTDITRERQEHNDTERLVARLAGNRELLARIIDAIPVMLFICDPESKSLQINREFTRVLGWTQEDANQIDLKAACYPDPELRRRALESFAPGWRDFGVTSKTSEVIDSSWANIKLSDCRQVGIGLDMRERLAAERHLKQSEARGKLALESMDLGTFDYDMQNRTVHWSDTTKAIYGLPEDAEVEFDCIWDAIPAEEAVEVRRVVQEAVENGSGRYKIQHRAIGLRDGVERWVAAWGRVVLNAQGAPINFTGLNLDITERKQNERILIATRLRQEILTEVMSRLLTSRNPQEIIDDLVKRVMAETGSEVFFNFLLDRRSGLLKLNAVAGASDETVVEAQWIEVGHTICGKAAETGAPMTVEEIQQSSDPTSRILRREGVRVYSCYPLHGSEEVLGTLGFGSRTKDRFAPADLNLMQDVAGYIAISLERMRDRNALLESEERYRIIARNIPDGGVWVLDHDLLFIAGEGPMAGNLGPTGTEIAGRRLEDTWPPDLVAVAKPHFLRALAGEPNTNESTYRGLTIFTHYVPIRDERSNVVAAMALALDITERKASENALRESERRERARAAEIEAIMDAVPAATWVARDPDCRQITANRFGYEILRVIPGANVSASAPDGERPDTFRVTQHGKPVLPEDLPVQVAARTGRPVRDSEIEVRFPDGGVRYLFGSAVPLLDNDQQPAGAVGAFIDLTERRKVEEQLRQAQKMESIGVLAGGVAHDFNNLLTGVLGNASLAQLDAPPRIADKLKLIVEAAEKAAGLTRQLLAYAGKGQFLLSDVDLSKVISSSSDLIGISISKNIRVSTENVPRRLPVIRADATQVQQVVINLVMNAAEAIGTANSGTISLAAGPARDLDEPPQDLDPDNYVYFRVTDTGTGMPEELINKIFDPFFTTKFTGRGLGLAAVQGIVHSLGGTVSVKSVEGIGSTFTVLLPCIESYPAEDSRTGFQEPTKRTKATVLVVDDEPLVRDVASRSLEKFGYRVLSAVNGQQAMEILDGDDDVNLVLLDVIMPVMGGLDALRQIRERWPKLTVLLTSGFDKAEAHRLASTASVPFIQKPYTVQQLAAAVNAAMEPGA